MCVCVYCVYVCIFVCVCVYMCVCICVCVYYGIHHEVCLQSHFGAPAYNKEPPLWITLQHDLVLHFNT